MIGRIFARLQTVLPKHWLTRVIWRIARIRHVAIKDFLITRFIALYDVDVSDVLLSAPDGFANFNDFFIRELEADARPISDDGIVSPVDGTVSIAARIRDRSLIQAKGIDYSLDDLLATDIDQAKAFVDGCFATIYLAPYNYHRVHAPWAGELVAAHYVPGDLFSVNQSTAASVKGLFRRNERLIMHFQTADGPAVLVFVGALNVGSISTPWSGEMRPRKHGMVDVLDLSGHPTSIVKGDLLGWFNMGSTVILLLPGNTGQWNDTLVPGKTLRVGEALGQLPIETS